MDLKLIISSNFILLGACHRSAFSLCLYSRCPIIREISPPGITFDANFERSITITLSLDTLLSANLLLLNEYADRKLILPVSYLDSGRIRARSRSSDSNNRFVCGFREAPISLLESDRLVAGALSTTEINKLLIHLDHGKLLGKTSARLVQRTKQDVEVHCPTLGVSLLPPVPENRRKHICPVSILTVCLASSCMLFFDCFL